MARLDDGGGWCGVRGDNGGWDADGGDEWNAGDVGDGVNDDGGGAQRRRWHNDMTVAMETASAAAPIMAAANGGPRHSRSLQWQTAGAANDWCDKNGRCNGGDGIPAGESSDGKKQLLDLNITRFMQKLEKAMRPRRRAWSKVISRVREMVAAIWPEARVEMYGSCYTGLELPSSDVDVVVCGIGGHKYTYGNGSSSGAGAAGGGARGGKGQQQQPRYNALETVAHLQQLAAVLQEQPWVRGMKVIDTASVPVIKILADPAAMNGEENAAAFHHGGGSNGSGGVHGSGGANGSGGSGAGNGGGGLDSWRGSGSGQDFIPLDISFESPQHG
ncbi:unnamed protein product [Phaeothamnion confervicola]